MDQVAADRVMRVEAVSGPIPQLLAELLAAELPERPAEGARPDQPTVRVPPISCAVVIGIRPGSDEQPPQPDPEDVELLAAHGVDLVRRLARTQATGERGELTWIDLETDDPIAVVVVGLGTGEPGELRRSAAALARRVRSTHRCLVVLTRDLEQAALRAFTEGLVLTSGTVTWTSTPAPVPPLTHLVVGTEPGDGTEPVARERGDGTGTAAERTAAVAQGVRDASATLLARRLIHTPSNIKDPAWIERQVDEIASGSGLGVRVWGPDELARDGFGGILAVGAGSVRPPRLIQLDAGGRGRRRTADRHVVLVGKGITFDSGGLSLKPPDMQVPMKTDMSGAAVVAAVLAALGDRLGGELRVTGLLALAENLPGASATRPGDIVIHHGGLRSEVVNTDAEGRLVLGDALDFAVADLRADVVVDVATLTGAATLGLGRRYAALFSTSDVLADALVTAGSAAGEPLWRMPLYDGYVERISSTIADQANADIARGTGPGSITAALFLRRFVGDVPWAHLDIAGVGRSDAEREEIPKGGTGFGVRALLRWIESGASF